MLIREIADTAQNRRSSAFPRRARPEAMDGDPRWRIDDELRISLARPIGVPERVVPSAGGGRNRRKRSKKIAHVVWIGGRRGLVKAQEFQPLKNHGRNYTVILLSQ
jgi:hypothetical protein